jgi:hypothetical protein
MLNVRASASAITNQGEDHFDHCFPSIATPQNRAMVAAQPGFDYFPDQIQGRATSVDHHFSNSNIDQ